MLGWFRKVVFRRVTGRNLGEFGGLRCREFPKEVKLGSVGDFGCFRVVLGWEWSWNGGLRIAGCSVDLGEESRMICWVFGVWIVVEKKRRKNCLFSIEKGEAFGSLRP